jgi:hypothetical protein
MLFLLGQRNEAMFYPDTLFIVLLPTREDKAAR